LLPPDVLSQSKHHNGYFVRIFELKKHKFNIAADRQWPSIRLRVAELLRDKPRQPIHRGAAHIQDNNNRPPEDGSAPQSPRYFENGYDDARADDRRSPTSSQGAVREDALILWRNASRDKGRRAWSSSRAAMGMHAASAHHIGRRRARSLSRTSDSDCNSIIDDGILVRPKPKPRHRRPRRRSTGDILDTEHRTLVSENLRLPATEDRPTSASSQLIRGKISAANRGMRTLLVYRAVLVAALGALAADTSCVYKTELGRQIIQVL